MTAAEVLQVSKGWNWGRAASDALDSQLYFPLWHNSENYFLRYPGQDQNEKLASREQLAQILKQRMNQHTGMRLSDRSEYRHIALHPPCLMLRTVCACRRCHLLCLECAEANGIR